MLTYSIIFFTSIVSILAFKNSSIFYKYQFNPYIVKHNKDWFRFISHAFLHADYIHLLMNMLVLYFFGRHVEKIFIQLFEEKGYLYFILLYLGGILFSVLPTFKKYQDNYHYNAVGASGAVSAIVFSFILLDPLQNICLYGLICFPGIVWGVIYLIYSYYKSKKSEDNINHEAHFWGAVFGVLFTIAIEPKIFLHFINELRGSLI